jgi:hypothetical protein
MLPELLGAEATPRGIDFQGKRYTFQPITLGILEQIEVKHFEQAKKRLKDMKDVLDEDTYAKKGLQLYEEYDQGNFGFFAARGQTWIRSPAGAMLLLRLVLGVEEKELIPLVLTKGEELKREMDLVLKEAGLQTAATEAPGGGTTEAPFRPDRRYP